MIRLKFCILKKFSAMYSKKCMIPSFRLPYSLQSIRDAIPLHMAHPSPQPTDRKGHRPSWNEFELATLSDPHWLPCLVDLPIAPFSMRMGRCLCHDAWYARHGQDTDSLAQAAQLGWFLLPGGYRLPSHPGSTPIHRNSILVTGTRQHFWFW